jgi:diaminohydroxyphosphoribosylaminopyrimidine deaminase/5-amino-6-(5-phosphoribosylamino)uracil reductase
LQYFYKGPAAALLLLERRNMNHEYYMQMALELARKGWPEVAPNPMVGCVIVSRGEVVASGYHRYYGGPHAEVEAIAQLPPSVDPATCVLYVSLEPCAHFGKTPPCTDLIIRKGFREVVIGSQDPNPLVAGRGMEQLRAAGIKVQAGVMEHLEKELNRRFRCFHEAKRPYFILKWAVTADGFISRLPVPETREENWITRKEAQIYVHNIRAAVMGVLVGKNTVLYDNPRLTTRLAEGKNPVRIFIDRNLEIPKSHHIYNAEAPTLVFNALKEEKEGHVQYLRIDFDQDTLAQICDKLYEQGIQTVLVEGGAYLVNEFVKRDLWEEVLVFQNPDLHFVEGLKAPVFALKNTFELVGDDKLFHHLKNESLPAVGPLGKEIF